MTIQVERVFTVDAQPDAVWQFIADPEQRANTISVVEWFEQPDSNTTIWHVRLPIPFLRQTIPITTKELERETNRYVSFVGHSRALTVNGEHSLEPVKSGTKITNRFVVDGKLPGVERFFSRQLDTELDRLERALQQAVS